MPLCSLPSSLCFLSFFFLSTGLSEELVSQMQTLAKQLLGARKKRQIDNILPPSQAAKFKCTYTLPLHSSADRGVTCCEFDTKHPNRVIASGGIDGNVILFDLQKEKTSAKLTAHSKPIRCIKLHATEPIVISASDDKTIRSVKRMRKGVALLLLSSRISLLFSSRRSEKYRDQISFLQSIAYLY